MLVFAQSQEISGSDFDGQSKSSRTQPNSFACHPLHFVVVIANAEVLLDLFPSVLKVVLRLSIASSC